MITNEESKAEMHLIKEYLEKVPYDVSLNKLYSAESLYAGYDYECPETFDTCHDSKVYKHYLKLGKSTDNMIESLARSLHDYNINHCMHEFLKGFPEKRVVAIMGGHALKRTDPMYLQIAQISKDLTEKEFLMVSGGGPGAMEATHLGAWLAGYNDEILKTSVDSMKLSPTYKDDGWLASAFKVMNIYPRKEQYFSLGVPTWLYGHEPSTPFASHIAKLFENSIREDSILTIAYGGIIYTPGSAGTMQEIFQDAVQNHYLSFDYSSPMVFLGKKFWTEEVPVYTMLQEFCQKGIYKNLLLSISDNNQDIEAVFEEFGVK